MEPIQSSMGTISSTMKVSIHREQSVKSNVLFLMGSFFLNETDNHLLEKNT